jgi:hypothetical protein
MKPNPDNNKSPDTVPLKVPGIGHSIHPECYVGDNAGQPEAAGQGLQTLGIRFRLEMSSLVQTLRIRFRLEMSSLVQTLGVRFRLEMSSLYSIEFRQWMLPAQGKASALVRLFRTSI